MDVAAWATISRLLDEALDLAPADRDAWLERLGPEHGALKPRLRAMLDRAARGDEDWLPALPDLSAFGDEPGDVGLRAGEAGARVGPYRLVREIASGGQGSVWLAERADGLLDRPVAVKLPIGLAFRPHLADRLARERRILASLTHPDIARLYDAGFDDTGTPYLAMEFVDGASIDRHCSERDLDIRARVALFVPVVRAVAFAHGRLVIHRDLKPSNILVTTGGDVRLLDFGIAKLLDDGTPGDSALTEVGGRAMTLRYASPEQVAGRPLGVATDIYSLGVVLYELLTGTSPPAGPRDGGRARGGGAHRRPVRPSDAAGEPIARRLLRGDLDTILLKALRKDPAGRYDTAGEFADDLVRYLDGRPVLAQPDSRFYRAGKFIRRRRVETTLAGIALIAIVAGAGVALWQTRVARAEATRAEAVKDFVVSMFRDVDPNSRPAGEPLTASDVLELARPRIATELADQPEARLELMRILGESLMSVGAPGPGAEVLRAALEDTRQRLGPDAPETIDTALLLATAGQYDTRSDEALTLTAQVLSTLEGRGEGRSEAAVRARLLRARVLVGRGQATDDVERAAAEALAAALDVLGPHHLVTADAFSTASVAYRLRGRRELALANAEASYEAYAAHYGRDPRHPRIIQAQNMLGRALYDVGRTAEAIRHLKEAAVNGVAVYGRNGLYQQQLLGTLANVQLGYGEIKEALANIDHALRADLGGARVSDTYLGSQDGVHARAFMAARQPAAAIPKFERAIQRFSGNPGGFLATTQVEYAAALLTLGRVADAKAVLEPLAARRSSPLSLLDRQVLVQLAAVDRLERRPARAIDRLREAAAFTPESGSARMTLAQARLNLGQLLLEARQVDEAEQHLREADALLQAMQGVVTPIRADVFVALGRVALARGDRATARARFDAARRFWQDFDATHEEARATARWLEAAR